MVPIMEYLAPLIGMIAVFATIAWGIWVFNKTRRERTAHMIELQSRMLEKFANSQDFVGFLQSPSGQQYLRSLTEQPRKNPKLRIIRAVQTGTILIILGVCLIGLSFVAGFSRPMQEPPFIIGFLSLFLGAGFIASAGIAYMLSKTWGLFPEDQP